MKLQNNKLPQVQKQALNTNGPKNNKNIVMIFTTAEDIIQI